MLVSPRFLPEAHATRPMTVGATPRPMSARGQVILETHQYYTGGGTPRLVSKDVSYRHGRYKVPLISPPISPRGCDPRSQRGCDEWSSSDFSPRYKAPMAGSWRASGPSVVETEHGRSFRFGTPFPSPRQQEVFSAGTTTPVWAGTEAAALSSMVLCRSFGA